MDQLSYKQLQKLAKERGIPANLKKENLIIMLNATVQDEEASKSPDTLCVENEISSATVQHLTEALTDNSPKQELIIDSIENGTSSVYTSNTSDSVEISNVQQNKIEETSATVTLAEDSSNVGEQVEYKKDCSQEQLTEEQSPEGPQREIVNTLSTSTTGNFEKLSYAEIQKIAKSFGINTKLKRARLIELIVEEQRANQAKVVVEMESYTPNSELDSGIDINTLSLHEVVAVTEDTSPDKVGSNEIDDIFNTLDWIEDSNCVDEEEESSAAKKLFTTPAKNSKIVFASPTPSKSGTKPYEVFNVKWSYDDYENKNPQQLGDDERVGGKLRGLATPKGEKITFTSPTKSTEKKYYDYNVRWTYDDYLKTVEKDI